MWSRLLLGLDQFESGQTALRFVTELAATHASEVRVLHIREFSKLARVLPIETPEDAQRLVDDAVFHLRLAGVGAEGRARPALREHVAHRITEEAMYWECDAIVLGSRRLRGFERLSAQGVRERVLRLSELPLVVAPTCAGADVQNAVGQAAATFTS